MSSPHKRVRWWARCAAGNLRFCRTLARLAQSNVLQRPRTAYRDAMFTGLVQHTGRVSSVLPQESGVSLVIDADGWSHTPSHGESIAVNGCCLTAADQHPNRAQLRFDVIHQTLRMTTLGGLRLGDPVNLESSVTPMTMLGGHIVQGHIDGVAVIESIVRDAGEHRLRIAPPGALMSCLIEKGSVALDGVSLTVAAVGDDWFEVALIPTTLALTTLGERVTGDRLNIETDYVAKIVARQVQAMLAQQRSSAG